MDGLPYQKRIRKPMRRMVQIIVPFVGTLDICGRSVLGTPKIYQYFESLPCECISLHSNM